MCKVEAAFKDLKHSTKELIWYISAREIIDHSMKDGSAEGHRRADGLVNYNVRLWAMLHDCGVQEVFGSTIGYVTVSHHTMSVVQVC